MVRQVLLQSLLRLGRQLGLILWLLVLAPLVLLLAVNTGPGQRLLLWGIAELSGGRVLLEGLSGALPAAPRLQRLELRDDLGAWLVIEDAALDLDLRALARAEIAIERLRAATVRLPRLPEGGGGGAAPVRLPPRVRLDHLEVADLRLGPAALDAPALVVSGQGAIGGQGPLEIRAQIRAQGRADHYQMELRADPDRLGLVLELKEGAGGLLPRLAGPLGWPLPIGLGDWRLDARAEGPYSDLDVHATLSAGAMQASARGRLDLKTRSVTALRLEARVPALTPSDAWPVAWQDLALSGDLAGPWGAPQGQVMLELEGLAAARLGLDRLILKAIGDPDLLRLEGELQGFRGPVPLPESAQGVPLRVTGQVALADPSRPFTLDLSHPLLALEATGAAEPPAGQIHLELPDLAPLAGLAGLDLGGSARVEASGALQGEPRLEASGGIALTRAPGPFLGLLGPETRISLAAQREGDAWRLDRTEIEGAGLHAAAQGRLGPDGLALGWTLQVPDLAALGAGWSGRLRAQGGLSGPPGAPDLAADLHLEGAYGGLGSGQVQGRIGARLAGPTAALELAGDWAGQPLALDLWAGPGRDGELRLGLREARWAGLTGSGELRLRAGLALPQGELRIEADRLADLAPLIALASAGPAPALGAGLDGRLGALLKLEGDSARIDALGDGLTLSGSVRVGALALDAQVRDPWGAAQIQGQIRATGLTMGATAGDLMLLARGPLRDLALSAEAALTTAAGPTRLGLDGRLDMAAPRLALQRLEAQAADQTMRLLSPAVIDLANGVVVDRLRLGLGTGSIDLAGRLVPSLDLNTKLSQLPLEVASLAAPDLPLTGTLAGEVRLSGPIESPGGSVRLQATGLRPAQGAGRALPPAELRLAADLGPAGIRIDASAQAGDRARLNLKGDLGGHWPFTPGDLDLHIDGRLDLALLDPLLTGSGRQAAGQALVDARLTGGLSAPRLAGAVRLTNGAFWDRTLGLVLTQALGRLVLAGDTLRIEGLTAQAGAGRLVLDGTVGALAPGIPVALRLTANDASPLQLDRLKVRGSGEIRLTGEALGRLEAAGALRLKQVEIRLPERLPAEVVTLEVRELGQRRAGQAPAPAGPGWGPDLGLDLLISAPRSVEVRGRGVDAELGGEVRVQGTLAEPALSGGFDLRRGEYELVGQTLRFTRGRLGFDGAQGLNPSLDLEARVSAAGSTAILAVEGTARSPRIVLKGEPEMPQDEVLSRLLFGVAGGRLSPWQATRLGLAAASLAGISVAGPGLLDRVREGLGLGDLRLGSDAEGGASLTGGRQLSERVYLGARQGTRAGEPQGVLRIEVSPRIQLEADVGPIGGTRAGAAFEIEY